MDTTVMIMSANCNQSFFWIAMFHVKVNLIMKPLLLTVSTCVWQWWNAWAGPSSYIFSQRLVLGQKFHCKCDRDQKDLHFGTGHPKLKHLWKILDTGPLFQDRAGHVVTSSKTWRSAISNFWPWQVMIAIVPLRQSQSQSCLLVQMLREFWGERRTEEAENRDEVPHHVAPRFEGYRFDGSTPGASTD
jgi:hypothetical protein